MKNKTNKKPAKKLGNNILTRLRKMFPLLEEVVDATEGVTVEVTKEDCRGGRKKDPQSCALAKACVRSKVCDAAVIGIGNSYLINGNVATRYQTSIGVAREITSFDRHQDFASGRDYLLSKVSPQKRLGAHRFQNKVSGPRLTKKVENAIVHKHSHKGGHRTTRIRVMARKD